LCAYYWHFQYHFHIASESTPVQSFFAHGPIARGGHPGLGLSLPCASGDLVNLATDLARVPMIFVFHKGGTLDLNLNPRLGTPLIRFVSVGTGVIGLPTPKANFLPYFHPKCVSIALANLVYFMVNLLLRLRIRLRPLVILVAVAVVMFVIVEGEASQKKIECQMLHSPTKSTQTTLKGVSK
jgi:hypothetical protein